MSKNLGTLKDFVRDVPFQPYVLIVGSGVSAQEVASPEVAQWLGYPKCTGNPRWRDIVRGHTIILCNGAPPIEGADIYMCFDIINMHVKKFSNGEWWYGEPGRAANYLVGHEIARLKDPGQDYYTYNYDLSLMNMMVDRRVLPHNPRRHVNPVDVPARWYLHGGATIVGCAYQLAMHYPQVKAINMIGCEMGGGAKWDREGAPEPRPVDLMNLMIEAAASGAFYRRGDSVSTYHIGESRMACAQIPPQAFYLAADTAEPAPHQG